MNTNHLTFTRFVAAFFIVFMHFAGELFIIDNEFIVIMRKHLYLGVDYFFVLSGFVMMLAYGNSKKINPINYLKNRIARVYPLHIFTLLLTIIIFISLTINYLNFFKFSFQAFALHLFLMQSWIPQHSLSMNVPSWSVSTEMFFYICFPFLFNFFINSNSASSLLFFSSNSLFFLFKISS